jgi:hypothetical protein
MPGMGDIPEELLQQLAAGGGKGIPGLEALLGGQAAPQRKKVVDKQKKKNLRKMQKKSRKRGR